MSETHTGQQRGGKRTAAGGGWIDEVLGDKGFDSDEIRGACLEEHDALLMIPNGSLAPRPHLRRDRENPP